MRLGILALVIGCSSPHPVPPPAPGSGSPPPVAAAPEVACKVDSDCEWTFLTEEIADPSQCVCETCYAKVVNRDTWSKWRSAWKTHCPGGQDLVAKGHICGVYECMRAPEIGCRAGACRELEMTMKPRSPLHLRQVPP